MQLLSEQWVWSYIKTKDLFSFVFFSFSHSVFLCLFALVFLSNIVSLLWNKRTSFSLWRSEKRFDFTFSCWRFTFGRHLFSCRVRSCSSSLFRYLLCSSLLGESLRWFHKLLDQTFFLRSISVCFDFIIRQLNSIFFKWRKVVYFKCLMELFFEKLVFPRENSLRVKINRKKSLVVRLV